MCDVSDLKVAMALLIKVFHGYSGKDNDPLTLSKEELKELLQKELGPLVCDKEETDSVFRTLDQNQDNSVDFMEYIIMVASLTKLTNEFFTCNKLPMMCAQSELQTAIALLIKVFHDYSGIEGDPLTLSNEELKELLQQQWADMPCEEADRIFCTLDENQDNCVDFMEYITMVANITMMTNDFFICSDFTQQPTAVPAKKNI